MSKFRNLAVGTAFASAFLVSPALAEKLGLGRAALPEEIAAWDLDVSPDGTGLPEGSGSVADGEDLFSDNCASCHGEFAEGVDNWPTLAGGFGTLDREDPVKTVGSYWPHLSTAWDYVNRSMPFGAAQTLEPDQVYAIVAYMLYSNDLVDDDFVLSRENFLEVAMPNADGFVIDDRDTVELPLFTVEPCMENCKDTVEITMHATVLDVTPDVGGSAEATDTAAEAEEAEAEPAPEAEAQAEPESVAETAALDPELVAAGEKVFRKCQACHKVGDDARNGTGPMLNGILGSAAGQVDGFRYSKPLIDAAEAGLVWTHEDMASFLENPRSFMKGTKMSFAGLKKPAEIEAVIAYLSTFTN